MAKNTAIRIIVIERQQAGQTVGEVLRAALHLARPVVVQQMRRKLVHLDGHLCQVPGRRVRAGQSLQIQLPALKEKSAQGQGRGPRAGRIPLTRKVNRHPLADTIHIRHLDSQILVVEKPAGVTTVRHADEVEEFSRRARKFLPQTLVDILPDLMPAAERKGRLRAVHRLDKETSGLVVLARTAEAESHLGLQFRAHSVGRKYIALVRGQATEERIESELVRDRGDGRRGTGAGGQRAVTLVLPLETLGNFTLVECRLETGRTHQIRIHLGERGTPLCGEHIYDRPPHGKPWPDASGATRPLLHGAYLAIDHPVTGERLEWTLKLPKDFVAVLERVRKMAKGR